MKADKYDIYHPNGSRIGFLVIWFQKKLGVSYNAKLGRGVWGKELQSLLSETHNAEVDLTPRTAQPIVPPYEITQRLSNFRDCRDWINANMEEFKNNYKDLYELIVNDLDNGTPA